VTIVTIPMARAPTKTPAKGSALQRHLRRRSNDSSNDVWQFLPEKFARRSVVLPEKLCESLQFLPD